MPNGSTTSYPARASQARPFRMVDLERVLSEHVLTELGRRLGTHRRQVARWREYGLTIDQADDAASRAGYHPSEVWSDWWEVVEAVDDLQDRADDARREARREMSSTMRRWAESRRTLRDVLCPPSRPRPYWWRHPEAVDGHLDPPIAPIAPRVHARTITSIRHTARHHRQVALFEMWRALQEGDDVPSVEDLYDRPSWMAEAACRGRSDVCFFPERGQPTEPAKAVCGACPVRAECADYAIENDEVGVWGGLSGRERRRQRRAA